MKADVSPPVCALCAAPLEVLIQDGARTRREWRGMIADIHLCTGCGHLQFFPLPTQEHLAELTPHRASHSGTCRTPQDAVEAWWSRDDIPRRVVVERLRRVRTLYFDRRPRLFDLGCGYGGLVSRAAELDFDASGCDLDAERVAFAAQRGNNVRAGGLDALPSPADPADVVTCYRTLEHLPEPLAALRAVRAALRQGGWLVVSVPNGAHAAAVSDWFGAYDECAFPQHLHYFTARSLCDALRAEGFEPVEVTTGDDPEPDASWAARAWEQGSDMLPLAEDYLSGRTLHVVARAGLPARPAPTWRAESVTACEVDGVTFELLGVSSTLATPRLALGIHTARPLPPTLMVSVVLYPDADAGRPLHRDVVPYPLPHEWQPGKGYELVVPVVGLKTEAYEVRVGLREAGQASARPAPIPVGKIVRTQPGGESA